MNEDVARNNLPGQDVLEVDTQAKHTAVKDIGIEHEEILSEMTMKRLTARYVELATIFPQLL